MNNDVCNVELMPVSDYLKESYDDMRLRVSNYLKAELNTPVFDNEFSYGEKACIFNEIRFTISTFYLMGLISFGDEKKYLAMIKEKYGIND